MDPESGPAVCGLKSRSSTASFLSQLFGPFISSEHGYLDGDMGLWAGLQARALTRHLQGTVPFWVTPADATLENQQPLPSRIGSPGSGIEASPWEFTSLLAQVGPHSAISHASSSIARSTQIRFRCTALH